MAKDGITLRLEGGARLDRILSQLDPNVSSRIINSSLKKAHEEVRDSIAAKVPTAQNKVYKNPNKMGSRGAKVFASRNHKRGTLRKAIKSRISGRARPNTKVFIASVYVKDGGGNPNEDGFYGFWVQNGNKYGGIPDKYKPNDFMKKGTKAAKVKFKTIMEVQMLKKITKAQQKMINKLG